MIIKKINLNKTVPLSEIEEGGLFTYTTGNPGGGRLFQRLSNYTSYINNSELVKDNRIIVSEIAKGILWSDKKDMRVYRVKQLNELEVEI